MFAMILDSTVLGMDLDMNIVHLISFFSVVFLRLRVPVHVCTLRMFEKVDLYQLHWPSRYTNIFASRRYERHLERSGGPSIDEQVLAMGDLIARGKIKVTSFL